MLGLGDRNQLMRTLGYDDAVIRRKCDEHRHAPPRCKHAGCGAFKPAGELYCARHRHLDDTVPF